ncbi:MAG TPA: hypothetical protein VFK03_02455 [Candidatus Saccharimonadales bacterium]|nr:hypothetical protein [Candidatus Saccharimonadales bacterium]
MILFRRNPPAKSPASPTPQADDLPDPLTMAILNAEDGNIQMAFTHFNDALTAIDGDHDRAKAFHEFGKAMANAKSGSLGKSYLDMALSLAVTAGDEELASEIKRDLLLLDES